MTTAPLQSALSLLSAVATASQHPAFQSLTKSLPTTSSMPVTVSSIPATASAQPAAVQAPSTAPLSLPPAQQQPSAAANIAGPPVSFISNSGAGTLAPGTSPPAVSGGNLCETCHARPKYNDGTKTHPYCSKSCAARKNSSISVSANNSSNAAAGNCDYCHARPKYSDGKKTHDFCSKSCARNFKSAGGGKKQPSVLPGICRVPGCQKPVYKDPNGSPGEYCSMAHKTFAETACLMCSKAPKQGDRHYCGKTCADEAEKKAPALLEVPACHVTFKSVSDQFKSSWRHVGTPPSVRAVYKIVGTPQSITQYNNYRAAVETRGQFVSGGRSAGNENRRWHGTRRECNLGDKGHTQLCSNSTCSLCCIVRTSFDLSLFGKKTGWGRFGIGIYTSSTSSKSNDYVHTNSSSPWKGMLLNKVVVGKGYKMLHDNTSMTSPPPGYDSVLAEKGGSLNYDELVVYTNDAIRPSFLVMYDG